MTIAHIYLDTGHLLLGHPQSPIFAQEAFTLILYVSKITLAISFPAEPDASQMQASHPAGVQFRHPLPPDVRMRMQHPAQLRPGQVRSKHTEGLTGIPPLVFQPMDPRFRMMLQQRGQLPPDQAMQQRMAGPTGQAVAREASPLLAQQLAGPQQQQPQPTDPQESTEDLENDLNDLGVPDEDLLGMAEDFNILEFADALDEDEGDGKGNLLDDLAEEDSVGSAAEAKEQKESGNKAGEEGDQPPPPPYTAAGSVSRGPPPPYPGSNGPKQVRAMMPNSP